MSRFLGVYKNFIKQYPYLSQSLQSGSLMATGDVISQTSIEKQKKWDYVRTAQFASVGFFVVAPCLTKWYGFLAKQIPDTGTTGTVKKVALDQFVWAPMFIPTTLTILGLIQTLDVNESLKRTKRDYKDVLSVNYRVWPWVQLVNFSFVPLQYQVLLVNVVALFWNTYISWKTHPGERG